MKIFNDLNYIFTKSIIVTEALPSPFFSREYFFPFPTISSFSFFIGRSICSLLHRPSILAWADHHLAISIISCLSSASSSSLRRSSSRATAATRNSIRSRSSRTDGTASFWSLPEPIPMSYSGDLGFFGKLSSSTIVFQLELFRSMSGSSRNQGWSKVGHSWF